MAIRRNMQINTEVYMPITEVSRRTGISRQWLNTKAKEGVIRVEKPFEGSSLLLYNLQDALTYFDVKK